MLLTQLVVFLRLRSLLEELVLIRGVGVSSATIKNREATKTTSIIRTGITLTTSKNLGSSSRSKSVI